MNKNKNRIDPEQILGKIGTENEIKHEENKV